VVKQLGTGSYSRVYLVERQMGEGEPPREFAMKVMKKSMLRRVREMKSVNGELVVVTALDRVKREVDVWRRVYHRNCVLLFECIDDPECNKLCLVMELEDGGPCMSFRAESPGGRNFVFRGGRCGVMPEAVACTYFCGLVRALLYLHERGIVHRDVKPDNVLVRNGRAVLGDFGCARVMPASAEAAAAAVAHARGGGDVVQPADAAPLGLIMDTEGTQAFFAPESCVGCAFSPYAADVWACGVALYVFLFGQVPFYKPSEHQLCEAIVHDAPSFAWPPVPHDDDADVAGGLDLDADAGLDIGADVAPPPPPPSLHGSSSSSLDFTGVPAPSDAVVSLLRSLLDKDPLRRPTLRQVAAHPWLVDAMAAADADEAADAAADSQADDPPTE
jgi:[calcium/calmodulin-dependent protein kinase] kinase